MDDSNEVHGISQSSMDTMINGKAFDYWKLSIDSIALADIDHLDVTYAGETYTLKRTVTESESENDTSGDDSDSESDIETGTESVTTYYVNDVEADGTAFQDFYRSALEMVCQSRLEKNNSDDDPELVLDYYGTEGEEVKVTYTARDSSFYTVEDQDRNSGLVNKMSVKNLIDKFIVLINEAD